MNIKRIIREELDDLSWMDDTLVPVDDNVEVGDRVMINYLMSDPYILEFMKQSGDNQGVVTDVVEYNNELWVRVKWDTFERSWEYPITILLSV